jgi:hypothetical protein
MAEQARERCTSGFGLSLIIMLLFNALLVVIKESSKPLMKGMAAVSGHHWTTHGIVLIVLFVVLGIIFSKIQPQEKPWLDAKGIMKGVIAATVIGYVVIVGFYLIVG